MTRTHSVSDNSRPTVEPPANFDAEAVRFESRKSEATVYAASRKQKPTFLADKSNRSLGDMVRHRNPVMLPETATVQTACRMMRDQRIGAILITGAGGRLAGLLTGRDVVCRVVAEALDPMKTFLYSVMTVEPDAMQPQRRAIDALRMMQDGGYRHMPVIDGAHIVGMVSRSDFTVRELNRLSKQPENGSSRHDSLMPMQPTPTATFR